MTETARWKKLVARSLWGLAGAGLIIQFVPYGRRHDNPPVRREPTWDAPATRDLARRACFDCHSNEVQWPWYSHVAPVSWLVRHDVDEGRRQLNFSEWDLRQKHARKAAREVEKGSMPPWPYRLSHADSRLSTVETSALIRGLRATFGDD